MYIQSTNNKFISQIIVATVLCLGLFTGTSANKDILDFETDIRSVIEIQLKAFARGDASTAYAQAAPSIRAKFPTDAIFMMMVRSGYAALIDPRRVNFIEITMDRRTPIYQVSLESRDGQQWMAFYRMSKQPEGNWLIEGCVLTRISGQSV
tara:strand:+ start:1615 stop:2067 length:453 start_codon:yes stop_codon:yes gene_type:complete